MNKTLKIVLIVFGVLVVGAGLVFGGVVIGRGLLWRVAPNISFWGHGPGMMGSYPERYDNRGDFGPGMMFSGWNNDGCPYAGQTGAYGRGYGMMGGGCGYSGRGSRSYGPGMMGGYVYTDEDLPALSIDQAETALADYLDQIGDDNLVIGEIMIFSNHAYAEIFEKDSGIGAMEVLVDPVSLQVYPEHGPNMMWNLKYGMHASSGEVDAEMPVSAEDAAAAAQAYLDETLPGAEVEEHADPFYGYYTFHILENGEVTGMLSVNGYSSDVFLHTWHGDFVEMSEE